MNEDLPENVLQQTDPENEKFVVVSIPSESVTVESLQLESQLESGIHSSDTLSAEPQESLAVADMQKKGDLSKEGLNSSEILVPTQPVAQEAHAVASSSSASGIPLLQWTPQQTMYTSAEAIQQDIQILVNSCWICYVVEKWSLIGIVIYFWKHFH